MMKMLNHLYTLLLVAAALPWALYLRFVKHRCHDICLVGERKDQACDNGYHYFKHAREFHPEEPIYYVIARCSPDRQKIIRYGNEVDHDTLQHYAYWLAAKTLVCAHLGSCVPDHALCWVMDERVRRSGKRKKIFIQHGITKESIPSLYFANTKVDLFVCGAGPETDFVASEFGYPTGSVRYLGFPRFDALHDGVVKKQILVMPTWRQWLSVGSTWGRIDGETLEQFRHSRYYQNYLELLNHEELHDLLKSTGHTLVFYPHHEMQSVSHLFTSRSQDVTIATCKDNDVQQLLKESAFLITDYSSVAFDFAYMRKPVVYFQFDHEEYCRGHYAKGYFDYERDGFGPVVATAEDAVSGLKALLLPDSAGKRLMYLERQKKFFALHDLNNCQRTYDAVQSICLSAS